MRHHVICSGIFCPAQGVCNFAMLSLPACEVVDCMLPAVSVQGVELWGLCGIAAEMLAMFAFM